MTLLSQQIEGYLERSSWIRRMFEAGIQLKQQFGEDAVCDFSLGNPDLPAPPAVAEGLRTMADRAGEPFAFGYMPNAGFPLARTRLAEHLSAEQGVPLTAGDVILTCGAAGALNAFLRAVFNPGDELLSMAPFFVEYGFYVANHGGTFRTVPTKPDTFALDLEAIEAGISLERSIDRVAVMDRAEPLGFVERDRGPFLTWINALVDRARSFAQRHIVQHDDHSCAEAESARQ